MFHNDTEFSSLADDTTPYSYDMDCDEVIKKLEKKLVSIFW